LVKSQADDGENTKTISREHTVLVSRSGLVTVTGGKWTTYRAMAEDVLAKCADHQLIDSRPAGVTENLRLQGAQGGEVAQSAMAAPQGAHSYGWDYAAVLALEGAQNEIAPGLTEAMVRYAARYEYAIKVEDVLARRCRMLFLDARLAASVAVKVAEILEEETGISSECQEFVALARQYMEIPV
jgi:glycerol-3-phosphate dehydrogenase